MKKAFTLAEIMIVLSVIAVLTAILLPAARNATPNEDILKFKKAHNTLYSAIRELVTSDKYYLNGDLGVKADGTLLYEHPSFYLCETLVDVLSVKESDCLTNVLNHTSTVDTATGAQLTSPGDQHVPMEVTQESLAKSKQYLDEACNNHYNNTLFKTTDNVSWYEVGRVGFGWQNNTHGDSTMFRRFSSPSQFPASYSDLNGMDRMYKIMCFDIDEAKSGEPPFGYGVRADGKILNGARADEWLERNIQNKD